MNDFFPQIKGIGGGEEAKLLCAQAHISQGDYDKAAAECREALKAHPRSAPARLVLGWIHAQDGLYEESLIVFAGDDWQWLVRRAVAFKASVVEKDERESSLRKIGPWLGSSHSTFDARMRRSDCTNALMSLPWCASITPTQPSR